MQLDETLFDITEDLNLDSWMYLEPRLASQRMPSEAYLRAIEAQAAGVPPEAYIEDRRIFRSPNLY